MKPDSEKRNTQLHILVSEKEVSMIKERMSLIDRSVKWYRDCQW